MVAEACQERLEEGPEDGVQVRMVGEEPGGLGGVDAPGPSVCKVGPKLVERSQRADETRSRAPVDWVDVPVELEEALRSFRPGPRPERRERPVPLPRESRDPAGRHPV